MIASIAYTPTAAPATAPASNIHEGAPVIIAALWELLLLPCVLSTLNPVLVPVLLALVLLRLVLLAPVLLAPVLLVSVFPIPVFTAELKVELVPELPVTSASMTAKVAV